MSKRKTNKITLLFILIITILLNTCVHTTIVVHSALPENENIPPLPEINNEEFPEPESTPEPTPLQKNGSAVASEIYTDLELSPNEIIVFSYEELATALREDNGYTTIYLGNDITATTNNGITIHNSKEYVVIDGQPPISTTNTNHTFTQYDNKDTLSTIHIEADNSTLKSITFQNLTINGNNLNGVIWIPESISGVTALFQDVTYEGPQAITNHSGIARFIDCKIAIASNAHKNSEELAEANHVQIGGVTTIAASKATSLLWLTKNNSKLCILETADVTISIPDFLLHADADSPEIRIEKGASFILSCNSGLTHKNENVKSFLVAENANVNIIQNQTQAYATLRVEELFEMQPGSMFRVFHEAHKNGGALHFPLPGGRAIFNNPKRVILLSFSGSPLTFVGHGHLEIFTTSLNMYHNAKSNVPTYIWNNAASKPFKLTVDCSGDVIQNIKHTLDANAPIDALLNSENFNLQSTQHMMFGETILKVNPIYTKSTAISGHSEADARILIIYKNLGGFNTTLEGNADSNGCFSIPVTSPFLDTEEQTVTVESYVLSLITRDKLPLIVLPPGEQLAFSSAPKDISFTEIPSPFSFTTVLRDEADFSFSVIDTRVTPKTWQVEVSLSSPLTATLPSGTHVLHNALVFMNENGTTTPLTHESLPIYTNRSESYGEFNVNWAAEQGILLNVRPGEFYSSVPYSATIQWSLVDAP